MFWFINISLLRIVMLRHLILALALLTNTSFAQRAALTSSGFDSTYKLTFHNAVQDKNFYLLSLFQRHPKVRKLLSGDKALTKLADDKLQMLRMAANCNDVDCFGQLLRLSGPDIETVANELEALSKRPEFRNLAVKDLRPSGAFIKYSGESDTEMLMAAWKDAANGMNRLLSVYCLGNDPVYKDIDKVSFDVSKGE